MSLVPYINWQEISDLHIQVKNLNNQWIQSKEVLDKLNHLLRSIMETAERICMPLDYRISQKRAELYRLGIKVEREERQHIPSPTRMMSSSKTRKIFELIVKSLHVQGDYLDKDLFQRAVIAMEKNDFSSLLSILIEINKLENGPGNDKNNFFLSGKNPASPQHRSWIDSLREQVSLLTCAVSSVNQQITLITSDPGYIAWKEDNLKNYYKKMELTLKEELSKIESMIEYAKLTQMRKEKTYGHISD